MFTDQCGLPDVTALVINASTKVPSYSRLIAIQNSVIAFDWSNVSAEFDGFIERTKTAIKPRKKVKESEALRLMSEHYRANKHILPTKVRDHRDLIIELIMEGFPADDAFSQAMAEPVTV
jgi:hypothetical protein